MRPLAILLFPVMAACGGPDEAIPDAATSGTADSAPPAIDAPTSDAPERACAPERTRVFTSDEPIEEGDHCDDIIVCAADAAQAAAIEEVAPGFTCGGAANGCAVIGCEHPGGTVSAEDMDEICAITVLPDPPDEVLCMIYLRSAPGR